MIFSRAQVVGNSAAVQANIIVPGMAGTHSSVDLEQTTRNTHTAGVGYQRGEPYAKWGRFACEMPTSRHPPRRSPGSQSWKSPPPRPRYSGGTETVGTTGQENDGAIGGDGRAACGVAPAANGKDAGGAHPHDDEDGAEGVSSTRTQYRPPVRGGSNYLEVTVSKHALVVPRVSVLPHRLEKRQLLISLHGP